jgi:hypothetical protein
MMNLRFTSLKDGQLILSVSSLADEKTSKIIEAILLEEAKRYSQKYKIDIEEIKLVDKDTKVLFEAKIDK